MQNVVFTTFYDVTNTVVSPRYDDKVDFKTTDQVSNEKVTCERYQDVNLLT